MAFCGCCGLNSFTNIFALIISNINLMKNRGCCNSVFLFIVPFLIAAVPTIFSLLMFILNIVSLAVFKKTVNGAYMSLIVSGEEHTFNTLQFYPGKDYSSEGECDSLISSSAYDINTTSTNTTRMYYFYDETGKAGKCSSGGDHSGFLGRIYQTRATYEGKCMRSPIFTSTDSNRKLNHEYKRDLLDRNSLDPKDWVLEHCYTWTDMDNNTYSDCWEEDIYPFYSRLRDPDLDTPSYLGYNGAYHFKEWNPSSGKYEFEIISNEKKWEGEMLRLITDSIISEDSTILGDSRNSFGESYYYTEMEQETGGLDFSILMDYYRTFRNIGMAAEILLLPIALSFMFPTFVMERVEDRNSGILDFLKMYGVRNWEYELVKALFEYGNYYVFLICVVILNCVCQHPIFINWYPYEWMVLLTIWGFSMVVLGSLFSWLQKQKDIASGSASIFVFLSFFLGGLMNIFAYKADEQPPFYYFLYPPFALSRGLLLISCSTDSFVYAPHRHLHFWICIGWLVLMTVLLFLFFTCFPVCISAFKTLKFWIMSGFHFLKSVIRGGKKEKKIAFKGEDELIESTQISKELDEALTSKEEEKEEKEEEEEPTTKIQEMKENEKLEEEEGGEEIFEEEEKESNEEIVVIEEESNNAMKNDEPFPMPLIHEGGDDDVERERNMIIDGTYPKDDTSIVIKGISKSYSLFPGGKKVVKDMYLSLRKSECFAILGPNGAGKTTLLKILTGEVSPSSGTADVRGCNIVTSRNEMRKYVSICPQFDCVFTNLSIKQNLFFFARVRGIPEWKIYKYVKHLMIKVLLYDHRNKYAGNLSGGMKRRLSIAIALIGDPEILLLDEPTTGLDPNTREGIWELIEDIKKERCLVLTTHAMEEANRLADRIGIMTNGVLRCLGELPRIKNKYSRGYQLVCVVINESWIPKAEEYVRKCFSVITEFKSFGDSLYFRIPGEQVKFSEVFENFHPLKAGKVGIKDWTLDQASLEEVFLKFAAGHDTSSSSSRKSSSLKKEAYVVENPIENEQEDISEEEEQHEEIEMNILESFDTTNNQEG